MNDHLMTRIQFILQHIHINLRWIYIDGNDIRNFLSISSHRLTSLTNFRWKALTSGFSWKKKRDLHTCSTEILGVNFKWHEILYVVRVPVLKSSLLQQGIRGYHSEIEKSTIPFKISWKEHHSTQWQLRAYTRTMFWGHLLINSFIGEHFKWCYHA